MKATIDTKAKSITIDGIASIEEVNNLLQLLSPQGWKEWSVSCAHEVRTIDPYPFFVGGGVTIPCNDPGTWAPSYPITTTDGIPYITGNHTFVPCHAFTGSGSAEISGTDIGFSSIRL